MIHPNYLNELADFTAGKVAAVMLNEQHEIQSFATKQVEGGAVHLEYIIPASLVSEVTLIQLMDAQGGVISSNEVYVPITTDTLISHPITIKEVSHDV